MSEEYTLDALPTGSRGEVSRLETRGPMRRRLMDMGLTPGASVQSLFRAAPGDPTAYLIQGAVVALRREDARTVLVKRA